MTSNSPDMSRTHAARPDAVRPDAARPDAVESVFACRPGAAAHHADRLWLAFQYLTDDLRPCDRSEFEDAMLQDERLAESLIEATRLLAVMSLNCQEWHKSQRASARPVASTLRLRASNDVSRDSRSPAGHSASRRWAVASVLVPLILVALAASSRWPVLPEISVSQTPASSRVDQEGAGRKRPNVTSAELLFNLYALDEQEDAEQANFTVHSYPAGLSISENLFSDISVDQDPDDDLLVPDWLLAAVQLDATGRAKTDSETEFSRDETDLF